MKQRSRRKKRPCRSVARKGAWRQITGATVALLARTSPASRAAEPITEQARSVATCAGRLSAAIEHRWLMADAAENRDLTLRHDFDELIAAILPSVRSRGLADPDILHLGLTAKIAQARLLQQADLNPDQTQARRARRIARRQLMACEALILS